MTVSYTHLDVYKRQRVNRLPLGASALAGTTFPIDRERVAKTLEFEEVCRNSLDAVSDRSTFAPVLKTTKSFKLKA